MILIPGLRFRGFGSLWPMREIYMSVLGVRPFLGRDFTSDDAGTRHTIISYGFWQGRLGGVEDVVGSEIRFEEGTATVIGVMGPRFRSPVAADLWFVMDEPPAGVGTRVGRMRAGYTPERARTELNALIARIDAEHRSNVTRDMEVRPASRVVRMALLYATTPLVAGVAVGVAASVGLSRLIVSYLFEVRPMDPVVFIAVAGLFLSVALLATYVPSRRSASVDPVTTLKAE